MLFVRAICALLLFSPPLPAAEAAAETSADAVHALTKVGVFTGDAFIPEATVLFQNGIIKAVGKNVKPPKDAVISDETGNVLIPGLVAADTFLSGKEAGSRESINTAVRACDGFDYFDAYKRQLASGTTSVYLSAGGSRLVPGYGSTAKLKTDPGKAILSKRAALEAVLTDDALNPPELFAPEAYPLPSRLFPLSKKQLPGTKSSQATELHRFLASEAALLKQLQKEGIPLRVRADTKREIEHALEVAQKHQVQLVIVGAREAGPLAKEIRKAKASVVWNSSFDPADVDAHNITPDGTTLELFSETPRLLAEAGVPVAISSGSGDGAHLLTAASFAVSHGFPLDKALAAITKQAAAVCGMQRHAGAIRNGRPADFVLLNGKPFEAGTGILKTYVNGSVVYEHEALTEREKKGEVLLQNALVLSGDGGRFPATDILIGGGKILAIGPRLRASKTTTRIDLSGKVVIPGMIDLTSRLGTRYVGRRPSEQVPSFDGSDTFLMSVGEIIRPGDPAFRACVEEGILGLCVRGARGSLIAGTGAFLLPGAEGDDFLHLPFACLDMDIAGSSRLSRLQQFSSLMKRLNQYEQQRKAHKNALETYRHKKPRDQKNVVKEPAPPGRNPQYDLLLKAKKREIPFFVRALRGDEITAVLKLLADEGGFECALVEAEDIMHAHTVERFTRGVILTPPFQRKVDGRVADLPLVLAEKGIPFALSSGGARGSLHLRYYAADAVRRGLSPDIALRSLTSVPARLLGIQEAFGVIAKGRAANLVVLDRNVFAPGSRVEQVLVQGKVIYQRSDQ